MKSFASLIDKLRHRKSSAGQLSVAVLEDVVYLAKGKENSRFEIESAGWLQTLTDALTDHAQPGDQLIVTLSAHHYQTFQLEKPELPREEWPVGLPFLLKDLVSERVTDIVADAIPLPGGNRIQAYVLSKKVLAPIQALCEKHQLSLSHILPEDELWGQSLADMPDFLLLHQSIKSSFKISAFVGHQACFNRTIRGVVAPLTGEMGSSLLIDGLALELQRSVDYLSSQVKQAQFHKLYLCCDDEDDAELVEALEQRLSVKVQPLQEHKIQSGLLLSTRAAQHTDIGINLYPAHLKPKKELFTLQSVVAGWGAVAIVMGLAYGFISYQNSERQAQISQLSQQAGQINQQLQQLQALAQQHTPSPSKLNAAERLEAEINAKQASLAAVGQFEQAKQAGYSGIMSALARLGRNDISLSSITLSPDVLNVTGLAKEPNSVPNWIKQFRNELDLVGRRFEALKIGRNENDVITFELVTKRGGSK